MDEPGWRVDPSSIRPSTCSSRRLAAPLVLNSPHSGALYPQRLPRGLAARCADAAPLRGCFRRRVVPPACALGAPLLRARFPRAFLDLNREPFELDPQMFDGPAADFANTRSLRVAAGLGVDPARRRRRAADLSRPHAGREALRGSRLHRPYHRDCGTAGTHAGAIRVRGAARLPFDALDARRGGRLDFVLGDRYGSSAAPGDRCVETALRRAACRVRRNKPYAGGYITEHYGAPAAGRHALQIEINRALYMDEARMVKLDRAAALGRIAERRGGAGGGGAGASLRRAGGRWAAE